MFDYKNYWDNRYNAGGNSGEGSYGENAIFKANFINNFINDKKIESVLEVGCGDGNNLGLYEIDNYLGLDVSQKAINICKEKYKGDKTKKFKLMDYKKHKADLVLCLDVTYHIFPRSEREKTIDYCVDIADRYVLFYSHLNPQGHCQHINDYSIENYVKKYEHKIGYSMIPPKSDSRFIIIRK